MVADAGRVEVRGTVVITGGGGNIGEFEVGACIKMFRVVTRREADVCVVAWRGRSLGKHLIRRLLATNTKMVIIDPIFHSDELEVIYSDHPKAANHGLLTYIPGDIRNTTLLDQVFQEENVSGVINLAAVSRVLWCLENKEDCESVNVDAVGIVLDSMRKNQGGLPWLIQASSREVYGDTKPGHAVRESDEMIPSNIYGETKLRAERVIEGFMEGLEREGEGEGLQAIALRLSNVYGGEKDHRERLVPAITAQAISHRPIQMVGGDQFVSLSLGFSVVGADIDRCCPRSSTWYTSTTWSTPSSSPSIALTPGNIDTHGYGEPLELDPLSSNSTSRQDELFPPSSWFERS